MRSLTRDSYRAVATKPANRMALKWRQTQSPISARNTEKSRQFTTRRSVDYGSCLALGAERLRNLLVSVDRPAVAQPGRPEEGPKASGCSGRLLADPSAYSGHSHRSVVGSNPTCGTLVMSTGEPLPFDSAPSVTVMM